MRGLLMALMLIGPASLPGDRARASTKTTAKKTTTTTV